jgi:hypothetical protein
MKTKIFSGISFKIATPSTTSVLSFAGVVRNCPFNEIENRLRAIIIVKIVLIVCFEFRL